MKRSGISFVLLTTAVGAAAVLGAASLEACGHSAPVTSSGTGTGSPTKEQGLVAFETMRSVLQHPRCQNCHPRGDAPLQGDDGHPHAQNVQRGPDGKGQVGERCTTCHGPMNPPESYGGHTPPGVATGWRMPKPEERLVFVGMAPGALCEQLKDPSRNGGKEEALRRNERLGQPNVKRPAGRLAWFHAASVGETNAVLPLMEALAKERPSLSFWAWVWGTTGALLAAATHHRSIEVVATHPTSFYEKYIRPTISNSDYRALHDEIVALPKSV